MIKMNNDNNKNNNSNNNDNNITVEPLEETTPLKWPHFTSPKQTLSYQFYNKGNPYKLTSCSRPNKWSL